MSGALNTGFAENYWLKGQKSQMTIDEIMAEKKRIKAEEQSKEKQNNCILQGPRMKSIEESLAERRHRLEQAATEAKKMEAAHIFQSRAPRPGVSKTLERAQRAEARVWACEQSAATQPGKTQDHSIEEPAVAPTQMRTGTVIRDMKRLSLNSSHDHTADSSIITPV